MRVTLFASETEAAGHRLDVTWPELCTMLSEFISSPTKTGQRGWSPAIFRDDHRRKANVEELSCLVLDIDTPDLPSLPEGLAWHAHSTFSGNWRLVVSLSRPYKPSEHERLRRAVMREYGIDETLGPDEAKDASRFYFGPCTPPGVEGRTAGGARAAPLDVDDFLNTVPEAPASAPAQPPVESAAPIEPLNGPVDLSPIIDASKNRRIKESSRLTLEDLARGNFSPQPGQRDNALHTAASIVASTLDPTPTLEYGRGVGQLVVDRMGEAVQPEGAEHWLGKWMFSFERARNRRVENEQKRIAMELALFPKGAHPDAPLVEVVAEPDDRWKEGLLRRTLSGGATALLPVGRNIELILTHEPALQGLRWNAMSMHPEWRAGPLRNAHPDTLDTALVNWLSASDYRLNVSRPDAAANLYLVSRRNPYEPVVEFLRSLKWDGTARAHRLLTHYFVMNDGNRNYLETISSKFLIGAVARALRPGCQMDTTLLLADNGVGGQGKTRFVRILGGEWYGTLESGIDKDALQKVTGKWFVELAEMGSAKRTDRERMRGFLTDTVDRFRPPYGRIVQEFPRRCVFVGTSNDETPIHDPYGKRRYWPVRILEELRQDELERDREQLFAEAVTYFDAGEQWWLDKEEETVANEERATMVETDAFLETVVEHIQSLPPEQRQPTLSIPEFLRTKLHMLPDEIMKYQKAAGLALRQAGWERVHRRSGWLWKVPSKYLKFGVTT